MEGRGERRRKKVEGWWKSKGGRGEGRGKGREGEGRGGEGREGEGEEASPHPCDMTYMFICNTSTSETASL